MITSIYYARLASMRLEHSVCRGSIMTTYIYFLIPFKWYEHPKIVCSSIISYWGIGDNK